MKVDRAKFLLLTGTIGAATALAMTAASGCTVVQKGGDDGGAGSDPTAADASASTADAAGDAGAGDGGEAQSCLGESASASGDAGAIDCAGLAANGCDLTCER